MDDIDQEGYDDHDGDEISESVEPEIKINTTRRSLPVLDEEETEWAHRRQPDVTD